MGRPPDEDTASDADGSSGGRAGRPREGTFQIGDSLLAQFRSIIPARKATC